MRKILVFFYTLSVLFVPKILNAETEQVGTVLAKEFMRDHMAYIDGNFISWYDADCDDDTGDNYEFRQHLIWTEQELENIMKKVNFTSDDIKKFLVGYNTNLTNHWYIKNGAEPPSDINQINDPASIMELYHTCSGMHIDGEKCSDFYYAIYEASNKKYNSQKFKTSGTYPTYGPLDLPITTLVWMFFVRDRNHPCRAGIATPTYNYFGRELKEVDNNAVCSYSEKTEKYKCILNKFYNDRFRCTISYEGRFYRQDNDLLLDASFSESRLMPVARPYDTLDDEMVNYFGGIKGILKYNEKPDKITTTQRSYF